MIVGIDFDGTLVKHEFPLIGDEVPHAARVIRRLKANGHQIILWTMRSNNDEGMFLKCAVDYCIDKMNLGFDHINENPDQKSWTTSPKAYCNVYIDDAAVGCPLLGAGIKAFDDGSRPYVDWLKVEQQLFDLGYFKEL